MQTYGQPQVNYPWYAGNARYTGFSVQFLAAHIGQIASMCFFAGTFTTEFFGPVLELRFVFSPYFADIIDTANGMHTSRFWICNFHFYWAFFCL